MKIINEYPPNIEAIKAVFPLANKMDVCFAYAPDIYHPGGNGKMYAHIIMHEKVHIERQLKIGVEAWWDRYLTNVRFRYYEELLAHRAEYEHLAKNSPSRQARRVHLATVAKKLSQALYGGMVTTEKAKKALLDTEGDFNLMLAAQA